MQLTTHSTFKLDKRAGNQKDCEHTGTGGTPGQLEYHYLALQFLGYIFENRNGCGMRRSPHNKTYIHFFFSLSRTVPVSR